VDVIAILAFGLLAVCAVFLGWVYVRIAAANRKHWKDVGYRRKGLFLDRPPEDSGAPWVLQEREQNARRPNRDQGSK